MKKYFPFLIGGVLLLLLSIIILSGKVAPQRRMDERITLKQRDKIPYGTHVARELLPGIFPQATVLDDAGSPGDWSGIKTGEGAQAVILVADYLDADEDELKELADFVEEGNYVFIMARAASDAVPQFFHLSYSSGPFGHGEYSGDSMAIRLAAPAFTADSLFTYPGQQYESSFYSLDTDRTVVLGANDKGTPNFIRMDKGKGSFFIHAAPLAFSNYFVLHKNNVVYYQNALSAIPKNVTTVLWNEYYLEKRASADKGEPNWLGVLFQYAAFKWGLLVAAFTLALYVLLGMRRNQRLIPLYQKPVNDALDFVKTLGRLYYDKKDHKNLADKMAAYFLEHVRSVYKIPTHTLDADFIRALHHKSGYAEEDLKMLTAAISDINLSPAITAEQLAQFHKSLELFYQNT